MRNLYLGWLSKSVLSAITLVIASASYSTSAQAFSSLSYNLKEFTGDTAGVNVTLTETAANTIRFDVQVDTTIAMADLRGLFFNINGVTSTNSSFLNNLTLTSGGITTTTTRRQGRNMITETTTTNYVTSHKFQADSLLDLGGDVNMNGGGSSSAKAPTNPFDVAIEFGSSGIGKDDYQFASFTLSGAGLNLSMFENQVFGARLMSVGANRGGSSKLTNQLVPPPPPPVVEQPKIEEPKVEPPKVEEPKVEPPKVEEPKIEIPTIEEPKVEPPKVEEPKIEIPTIEEPKVEPPKVEEPKEIPTPIEDPTPNPKPDPKPEPEPMPEVEAELPEIDIPDIKLPPIEHPDAPEEAGTPDGPDAPDEEESGAEPKNEEPEAEEPEDKPTRSKSTTVPEPGMTAAVLVAAAGAMKFLKRQREQ